MKNRIELNPYENSRDGYVGNVKNSGSPININVTTEPTYDDVRKQQNFMNYLERPKYTVRFFDEDKETEYTELKQTVKEGDLAKVPTKPIKEGYVFLMWKKITGLLPIEYNFNRPVDEDIRLVAVWREAETYTITFMNSYTGAAQAGVEAQTVLEGNTAINPGRLENWEYVGDIYIFRCWSTIQHGTVPFDFSTPITSDIVIWSEWIDASECYTITYDNGEIGNKHQTYDISYIIPNTVHNILTMEEVGLHTNTSKTSVLYWDCSNGTSYSPAGNYVASAGSATAAAASMAHSVTVNSNLTFTAHTITSDGTSDNTELFTFTFTPADGAGGTRTFVTGYKYRAASAGHTFVDPSTYGITTPTGKSFDHWEMTYRDYYGSGDPLPSTITFAVGDTLATQRNMYFIPVYVDVLLGTRSLMARGLIQPEETEINLYTANIDGYIGNKFNSPNMINVNNYDENEIIGVEVINGSQGTQKLKGGQDNVDSNSK